ncbi:hypothetical protein D3C71_1786020 [compost metagenome]
MASPDAAETIAVEHCQWDRVLLVRAMAVGLGPDEALLAQQLTDFVTRFTGDDGQVQVLALQQLLGRFAMHFHLYQRVGLGEARENSR